METDLVTERIIGAAIEVHRHLGPGLLESTYEHCLCHELQLCGIPFRRQADLPITFKGLVLECGYRLDLIVEEQVVVELKALDATLPVHFAQLRTYLRLSGFPTGLLINFNVSSLRRGINRLER
jgi:GxxExxY protein